MYTFLFHLHTGAWPAMILIFFVVYFLIRAQKEKISKILSMVLRLVYIAMLGSGAGMVIERFIELGFTSSNFIFLLKGVLAFMLIGTMEAIHGKTKRGERATPIWIVFTILLITVLVLGYLKL
ncbi:DUF1516 family protein [Bacillus horti]|uniref:ABC-type transport system involved in cytochrome c biogenesis permease subunit n=1 Tax=Caldalkalibacillus horti TaxID=77523 RepID=A0ABT9W136_9BACI|nr:DUF1516 family protein [Bacillus horti]MDQ0166947.1 ABC-type transport system involved in cytochrome c biogenesis permease subunit [Bacillus horti]